MTTMEQPLNPWGNTPPPPPRPVAWGDPEPEPEVAGVDDLFAAPQPTTPENGVDDLFAAPTEGSAAPPAQPTATGVDDLFGEEPPSSGVGDLFATPDAPAGIADVFASGEPSRGEEAPTEAPSTTSPDKAAASADADSSSAPTSEQSDPFGSLFATDGPPNPFAAPSDDGPKPIGRLAAARAAAQAARPAFDEATAMPVPSNETLALAGEQRYSRMDELYPKVLDILALAGAGTAELAKFLNGIELTRDHALDERQRQTYQMHLEPLMVTNGMRVRDADELRTLFDMAYDETLGIGPLGPLWRDDSVSEILVSGWNKVTIERAGRLEHTHVRFRDPEHLEETGRALASRSKDDRALSPTNPLVTLQLPGARLQFVWKPLSVLGGSIAIRKFGALMAMDDLMARGSLNEPMRDFLAQAVAARATILVSGGTGSGKTTFINALSEFIPTSERVVTIEDALELQLRNQHVESFVTKEAASADDRVLFGQDALLKATLRMRPDRIIVGEIRDGRGCAVMLEAANTGHDGTMTTVHANTPELALKRMTRLLRTADALPDDVARDEVAGALDLVVQVVRTRGQRFVSHISVVDQTTGRSQDVFVGEILPGHDRPTFRQVGGIGSDTGLAFRLADANFDTNAWRLKDD